MKFKSLTVCETCLIDARSNNISIINLIEECQIIGSPTILPKATVIIQLERNDVKKNETVSMIVKANINGDEILNQPLKADFKGKIKSRTILEINGLTIKRPGILTFVLIHKGKKVLEYPIVVKAPDTPDVRIV